MSRPRSLTDRIGPRWNPRLGLLHFPGMVLFLSGLDAAGVRPWPAFVIFLGAALMAQGAVGPVRGHLRADDEGEKP